MGIVNECECGKILTKEETEYKNKYHCLCRIAQKHRREKKRRKKCKKIKLAVIDAKK